MLKRKNHSPEFKAKVTLEALKGGRAITELASEVAWFVLRFVKHDFGSWFVKIFLCQIYTVMI